ncbi:MAG: hypothetical protein RL033_2147 [Pseudomonadota bacterium]|jgi:mono/diheme cytochrome c family protein
MKSQYSLVPVLLALLSGGAGCYLTLDDEELDAKGAGVTTDAGAAAGEGAASAADEFTTSLDTPPIELDVEGEVTTRDPCVATTLQAREILTTYCSECHAPPGAAGGFASILDFPTLINARSTTQRDPVTNEAVRLLIPGSPEQSRLYLRARTGEMPPRRDPALPQLARPTVSSLSVLRTWISSCVGSAQPAPAAPPAAP